MVGEGRVGLVLVVLRPHLLLAKHITFSPITLPRSPFQPVLGLLLLRLLLALCSQAPLYLQRVERRPTPS